MHRHGLVHRDIKPSNIIFVNGIPKLADIGLVTSIDATLTYVGTEGFMPPEGPGTPQADVYSLGKVLYEACTGKDRQEFPDLPTAIRASAERNELLELNEVVVKACAADPRKRYQSAEEMHADLALLRSGKSIRRLRVVELRLARARTAGLAAGAAALFAVSALCFFAREARVERDNRKRVQEALNRAEAAEQAVRQESYARAMLLAHQALQANNFGLVRDLLEQTRAFAMEGAVTNSASRQAKPTLPSLPAPVVEIPVVEDRPEEAQTFVAVAEDTNKARSAGPWEWRRLQHECRDEAVAVLGQCAGGVGAVTVSPDGKWLAAGEGYGKVLLWDLSSGQLRQERQVARVDVDALAFSPNSQRLATGGGDGSVRVLAIPSGEPIAEFHAPHGIIDLRFSQDGTRLAYCSGSQLTIDEVFTGKRCHEMKAAMNRGHFPPT